MYSRIVSSISICNTTPLMVVTSQVCSSINSQVFHSVKQRSASMLHQSSSCPAHMGGVLKEVTIQVLRWRLRWRLQQMDLFKAVGNEDWCYLSYSNRSKFKSKSNKIAIFYTLRFQEVAPDKTMTRGDFFQVIKFISWSFFTLEWVKTTQLRQRFQVRADVHTKKVD